MFKFEYVGELADIEVQKMISDDGAVYIRMTKMQVQNGRSVPTKQSITIPFEHIQKLKDLLNDVELYHQDVGYSETAPHGVSTTTTVPLNFKAEVLKPGEEQQNLTDDEPIWSRLEHDSDQVAIRTAFRNTRDYDFSETSKEYRDALLGCMKGHTDG